MDKTKNQNLVVVEKTTKSFPFLMLFCLVQIKLLQQENFKSIILVVVAEKDFNFFVQNYTFKTIGVVLQPGDEATFEYQFQFHPDLQPVDYTLAHTIFYDDNRVGYSTTFFNQTVELYYSSGDFSISTLGPLLWGLISTVAIVILTIYLCFPDSKVVTKMEKIIHHK